jgi:hypothetical protein
MKSRRRITFSRCKIKSGMTCNAGNQIKNLRPAKWGSGSVCGAEILSREWQQRVNRDQGSRSHSGLHVRFAPKADK